MTKPIVTVLSKSGCAPCESVKQLLKSKNIDFVEMKAFDHPEIAQKLKIRKVPTITFTDKPLNEEFTELEEMITGADIIQQLQTRIQLSQY